MARERANYLPAPAFFELNHACKLLNEAFGCHGCFLVGSAREHRDYRDVDIRLILENEQFDKLFPGIENTNPTINPFWSILCTTISLWLKQRTDLPIDFQIQRQEAANQIFPGANKRCALGIFLAYLGGG